MQKAEVVFVPSPGIGHLVSTTEMARLLVRSDERLSVTVLIMQLPFDANFTSYTKSLAASTASSDRISFVDLPLDESAFDLNSKDIVNSYMESHKPHVKDAISKIMQTSPHSPPLVGFFVDMFSTTMIDVASEYGVPTYVFYTSSAAFLAVMLHLQELQEHQNVDTTHFRDSTTSLVVSGLANPVPAKVLPSAVLDKHTAPGFLNFAKRYRETKGIVVNTFLELEPDAISSASLPVYPVGPILNLERDGGDVWSGAIIKWLDDQPPLSVVFLCFGSMGWFRQDQVMEIAYALERSGRRFLWSLRRPPPKGTITFPTDYVDPREVLPEGFLDRTSGKGKIIGWAPQVAILQHPAIGGFVSHCGWNSVLESLWFGVPIATWPIDGEQQFNAFEMVIELGLAVEIKLDYRKEVLCDAEMIVSADEIESAIRCLMEPDSEIRRRVKEMSERSKKALVDGGSSYSSLGCLIHDLMAS